MSKKIIIVGGVAGGATAAARLRRLDETSEIMLLERGEHISFANCGLPYYIGEVIEERSELLVQTVEGMSERFNLDIRNVSEVTNINREAKTITIKNLQTNEKYEESYDTLVLSPGARPIVPPIPGIEEAGRKVILASSKEIHTDLIILSIGVQPENQLAFAAGIDAEEVGVEKRIDVIATAISGKLTVFDLADIELSYAPPYSSAKDPVNMAGYVAQNIVEDGMETVQWHEVDQLIADGEVLIDVRGPNGFAKGAIKGSIHIPLY